MTDYTTILVFSYVDPQPIQRVNINATWYKEKRILESHYDYVIALRDGWKIRYSIVVYKFKRVKDNPVPVERLKTYLQANEQKKYRGWMHHMNVYEKVKGQRKGAFKNRIHLDIDL